jgi:hypothetical protein
MNPPACIFCGAPGPLTLEHITSKWISEELKGGNSSVRYRHERGERAGVGWPRAFVSQRIELAPRVVCGGARTTCNNGWMNDLETHMRSILPPMFRGQRTTLSAAQQHLIASWAMMKFMVAEHTAPSGDPRFFTQAEREEFCRGKNPPAGSFMWLADYGIGNAAGRSLGRHLPWPGGAYIGILGAGKLLILLVAHRGRGAIRVAPHLQEFANQIWPLGQEQTWPPSGVFDERAVEDFFSEVPAAPS